jgi:hypothetical protein
MSVCRFFQPLPSVCGFHTSRYPETSLTDVMVLLQHVDLK